MYHVNQSGKVIQTFAMFVDAWLFIALHLQSYAKIVGPDGLWTVNPSSYKVN